MFSSVLSATLFISYDLFAIIYFLFRPGRSSGSRRGPKPDAAVLEYYSHERQLAQQHGLKWRERGPRNADGTSDASSFRGQRWREGSQRFANRGGKRKVYFEELHRARKLGFSEDDAKKRAEEAQALVDQARENQEPK